MIEPTSKDVGRFVVYVRHDGLRPVIEAGRIRSFNELYVFVGFPSRASDVVEPKACTRDTLVWLDDLVSLAEGATT
jgi:hypothetical protein